MSFKTRAASLGELNGGQGASDVATDLERCKSARSLEKKKSFRFRSKHKDENKKLSRTSSVRSLTNLLQRFAGKVSNISVQLPSKASSFSTVGDGNVIVEASSYKKREEQPEKKTDKPCDKAPEVLNLTGIKNHGNTCFMNAIIQCLAHTDLLAEYFVLGNYKQDMKLRKGQNKKFGTRGEVTEKLAILLRNLWCSQYNSQLSSDFKAVVGKHGVQYRGYAQHDAQEFFLWLLDKVHEDLNRATKKKYKPNKVNKDKTNINDLPAEELDHLLAKFFKDVRKLTGKEYEPGTLTGFQRSIQRFLSDSGSSFDILKDDKFSFSRKVLEAKRKNLVLQGKGNKPNATRSVTDEEEEKLFKSGEFGNQNPASLQRTMWWFLSLHFGFRARDESRKLCWGDVVLQTDPVQDGREMLVWTSERGSKTRKGAENGHQRPFCPKIYASNTNRCPVLYYKLFKSHRPEEMNEPNSPFFLAIRHGERRQNPNIWYMKAPLGKNEIGKFLTTAAANAGLQRQGAKIANHSVRKTSIGRLLDANTPETFVAQLSGHKNLQSLQSYKSANDDQQRQMSYILSRASKPPSLPLPATESSSHSQIIPTESDQLNRVENSYSQSLAISNASTQAAQSHGVFSGASIESISDCQFQVFNGPVKIVQQSKKRRFIIESDDED